eukprot:4251248-Pleurochrysis_carterae.AAC.1
MELKRALAYQPGRDAFVDDASSELFRNRCLQHAQRRKHVSSLQDAWQRSRQRRHDKGTGAAKNVAEDEETD